MTAVLDTSRLAWTAVCHLADLLPERGAAALVQGEQVALVRLHGPDGGVGESGAQESEPVVLAVQQLDPFSGAHVMSRGIVGTRGEVPTLASPMYKQVFDLRTGVCLDRVGREPLAGHEADLRTWPVRVEAGLVLVGSRPAEVAR
ncbi:nitrite reductase (NAD(P)H) small subunit [Cellulomonas sp. APG4]|uniref:nitrite reductase (NAD(P)H) small subunit family protein n=1 Tax=Cellulomonas sp. APG4 TaxID=1538656 RepID=UPI00137B641C|nr:nitrite reductase (NAD(P)H) small subunit family protein [Cellulomonas sp. APG4]NCT92107.1 nitrite reductase (NAD(P)H) small subunit [Cellulomonas sp. APG4]